MFLKSYFKKRDDKKLRRKDLYGHMEIRRWLKLKSGLFFEETSFYWFVEMIVLMYFEVAEVVALLNTYLKLCGMKKLEVKLKKHLAPTDSHLFLSQI